MLGHTPRHGLVAQLLGPGLSPGLGLRRGQIPESEIVQVDQHDSGCCLWPRLQVYGVSRARAHVLGEDVASYEGTQEENQDHQDHPHVALSLAGAPRSQPCCSLSPCSPSRSTSCLRSR